MKRKSLWLMLFLVIGLCFSNVKAEFPIGTVLEDFKLTDINGVEQSFNSLKGEKGTIFVFLSIQCPVVKKYDARINELAAAYKAKGINVIGINSNYSESPADVKAHADLNYKFPVLLDKGNVIADKLEASATPEMYFFSSENKLIYHGAVDDDQSGSNVKVSYLRNAMEESLSGKEITRNKIKAFGCTIKRAAKTE